MNKATNIFNWHRFLRVLTNDLMLLQARRIGFASLGFAAIGLVVYLSNITEVPEANQGLAIALFAALLIGGGHIFTSMIFNDMHHPLERFHYLMLPCSNLERFVSRYLITAPLFIVYAIVLYKVFETIANFLIVILFDDASTIPLLDFSLAQTQNLIVAYFALHVFSYTGAIWFRSYAFIKTQVAGMVFWMACGAVMFLAVRIIYWDSFISLFELNPEGPFPNIVFGSESFFDDQDNPRPWAKVAAVAFLGWFLFLAYLGLKEHEVQDGL
jgi:hypothetical protein